MTSVDASMAGEGQLVVDVSHDGRNVPAGVIPGRTGRYHISFIPDRPGTYQIRICFAGVAISGKRSVYVFVILRCGERRVRVENSNPTRPELEVLERLSCDSRSRYLCSRTFATYCVTYRQ